MLTEILFTDPKEAKKYEIPLGKFSLKKKKKLEESKNYFVSLDYLTGIVDINQNVLETFKWTM